MTALPAVKWTLDADGLASQRILSTDPATAVANARTWAAVLDLHEVDCSDGSLTFARQNGRHIVEIYLPAEVSGIAIEEASS